MAAMKMVAARSSATAAVARGSGVGARSARSAARRSAVRAEAFAPPTVADTKKKFMEAYPFPIPALYNNVIQELLVQMHFTRYSINYTFDPVTALGMTTVFDQLMDGYRNEEARAAVFAAYVGALDEDPADYKAAAASLEAWASGQSADSLVVFSEASGEVPDSLKAISEKAAAGKGFQYSKYFAVGLFRMLELSNASEPSTLEKLCASLNVAKEAVDKDLDIYRGLLSKLTSAKELMAEFLAREQKKKAEREAAAAESEAASETDAPVEEPAPQEA